MAIQYSIFLCLAVIMTSQQTTFAAPVLQQLESFIEVNSTVLNQFIDKKIENAFGDHPFLFNLNTTVLEDYVKKMIDQTFADQPIIKMFNIGLDSRRNVTLNLKTFKSHKKIAEISLINSSVPITSSNNLLAYRPRYSDVHESNLAGIFLNAEKLTCGSTMCKILSGDEDGFNKGRAIIEAGDGGNNFKVFNSTTNIPTYGFAIEKCPEMNPDCLPNWYTVNIVCYVSRDCV